MTDTTKRDAVREKVVALQDLADDLHAEIRRLRAAVEQVRALHVALATGLRALDGDA